MIRLGFLALAALHALIATDWDARLQEVCGGQPAAKCHGMLIASGGRWKEPKAEILAILREDRAIVAEAARLYHVDPAAIASVILAENSLNGNLDDAVIDHLIEAGGLFEDAVTLANKGSSLVRGQSTTIGLGQISIERALTVEARAMAIEKRDHFRSYEEIQAALTSDRGSIFYAAAILADAIEAYRRQGFDVTGDIPVQATLYNLGQVRRRAREAKAAGRTPRENYFGLFVEKNLPGIRRIFPVTAAQKESGASAPAPPEATPVATPATKESPVTGVASIGRPKKAPTTIAPPVETSQAPLSSEAEVPVRADPELPAFLANREVTLLRSPPSCRAYGKSDVAGKQKIETYQDFAASGILRAGERFVSRAPGTGCEFVDWVLLEAESGSQGWLRKSEWAEIKGGAAGTCALKRDSACAEKLQAAFGADCLGRGYRGLVAIRLAAREGKKEINWLASGSSCWSGQSTGQSTSRTVQKPEMTPELRAKIAAWTWSESDKSAALEAVEEFKSSLKAQYGLKSDDDLHKPVHPYWMLPWGALARVSFALDRCVPLDETVGAPQFCALNRKALEVLRRPLNPKPTYTEVRALAEELGAALGTNVPTDPGFEWFALAPIANAPPPAPPSTTTSKLEFRSPAETLQALDSCWRVPPALSDSSARLADLRVSIEKSPPDASLFLAPEEALAKTADHCRLVLEARGLADSTTRAAAASCGPGGQIALPDTSPLAPSPLEQIDGLSRQAMLTLLRSDEDQDRFLEDHLPADIIGLHRGDSSSLHPSMGQFEVSEEVRCSYDPFATASRVRAILGESCVRRVFLPEPVGLVLTRDLGEKVQYHPIPELDRLYVDVSSIDCGGAKR